MDPSDPSVSPDSPHACANCGHAFAGAARPNFCPDCGQETHIRAPRLSEFVQQFGGAYFATEGALWRTLKLLLIKPGELTRQYLAGRRKHFVLPLRLYLTISLLALLALRVTAGLALDSGAQVVRFDGGTPREMIVLSFGDGQGAGVRDGVFFCDGLPGWVCTRLKRRLDVDEAGLRREIGELGQRFVGNIGVAVFFMLPLFAAMLKLAYWGRRLRYTEHLVMALHLHAFWFVAMLAMLPDRQWLTAIAFTVVPLYTLLAMRRVYGGRWWPRLLRAGAITLVYAVVLAFVLTGVGLWSLVF